MPAFLTTEDLFRVRLFKLRHKQLTDLEPDERFCEAITETCDNKIDMNNPLIASIYQKWEVADFGE